MKKFLTLTTCIVLLNACNNQESTKNPAPSSRNLVSNTLEIQKGAKVTGKTISIDGLSIFYREAGMENKETILLLHGFPLSSHMFKDVMADISDDYHVIAMTILGSD